MWSDFDSGAAAGFYSQNRLGFSSFRPTFCLRARVRTVPVTDFVSFSRKAYNVISVSAIPFRIRASPQLVRTPDDPRPTTAVLVKPHGTRLGLCLRRGVAHTAPVWLTRRLAAQCFLTLFYSIPVTTVIVSDLGVHVRCPDTCSDWPFGRGQTARSLWCTRRLMPPGSSTPHPVPHTTNIVWPSAPLKTFIGGCLLKFSHNTSLGSSAQFVIILYHQSIRITILVMDNWTRTFGEIKVFFI